jgi:hypothetical protein
LLLGRVLLGSMLTALAGCGGEADQRAQPGGAAPQPIRSLSPDAKLETVELLRADLEAERHPADGGGRAWLAGAGSSEEGLRVRAGGRGRFRIVYEAGPLGVVEGGVLFLQTSPFWYWDTPQVVRPDQTGYTTVETGASGVTLAPQTLGQNLLGIRIEGRALEAGERVEITFGAAEALARVDRYAEREARLWVAVDGDGDGVRELVAESPSVEVVAAEPAQLVLALPTTARPGEAVRLTAAVLDRHGNAGVPFRGELRLAGGASGLDLPDRIPFELAHQGRRTVEGVARSEGVYRVEGAATGGLVASSNPLVVRSGIERVQWGDLHGHSNLSDGSGTPEDFLTYARDVAGLDVVALTDHDHWGMRFLDASPDLWRRIQDATRRFHDPGRFVTILGYEWTNWLHGPRHVLYFSDEGQLLSSMDPRYETPAQLWGALRGQRALTFAHHSAGGPIATDWGFPPDPVLEPVTEVASVHGSSEAPDSPQVIYDPVAGNFIRDVLDRGSRFGFIGSGDSHNGHPGLVHLERGPGSGGLAAILADARTRKDVLDALRARRVYATNGPRIWLSASLDGHPMGTVLSRAASDAAGGQELKLAVVTPEPIERIELIRSGEVIPLEVGPGQREWSEQRAVRRLEPGEYLYLRVVQVDSGAAWSSPFYAD